MHNVVVVSRQTELQELAHQIAENVFAADDIIEAAEATKRVNPELIIFDNPYAGDAMIFAETAQNLTNCHIVIIGNNKQSSQSSESSKGRLHYIDGISENSLNQLVTNITRESQHQSANEAARFFLDDVAAAVSMVGKTPAIQHALKMLKIAGSSQCNPILIIGEMGTGKELAARTIYNQRCPQKEFIAVNCASLSTNLLESELFGHEKGAFTSADREKTGLLELAGSGCIFLDEISEMPPELQAKLLRVIQEKTFRRVGGTKEITCRATIIASSNRDLKKEVQANRFRGDLYHRLSLFPILLSPLRSSQRRQDIRLLAEYFLKTSTMCPEKAGHITSITQLALEILESYDWPGNVRELKNVIERAILLEETDKIRLESIIINPEEPQELFKYGSNEKVKDYSLAKAEQELIARVLQETNWQKTKAAELLGISRATLYAKVKQHNLESDSSSLKSDASELSEELSEQAVA